MAWYHKKMQQNKIRRRAYRDQQGLCLYCRTPTFLEQRRLMGFSKRHDLDPSLAQYLQATAEHLVARQDGGKDKGNIASACLWCNQERHQSHNEGERALEPEAYARFVQLRVAQNMWFPFTLPDSLKTFHTPLSALLPPPEVGVSWWAKMLQAVVGWLKRAVGRRSTATETTHPAL